VSDGLTKRTKIIAARHVQGAQNIPKMLVRFGSALVPIGFGAVLRRERRKRRKRNRKGRGGKGKKNVHRPPTGYALPLH